MHRTECENASVFNFVYSPFNLNALRTTGQLAADCKV